MDYLKLYGIVILHDGPPTGGGGSKSGSTG